MSKHKKLPAPPLVNAATEPTNLELAVRVGRKALSVLEMAIDGGDSSPQTAREVFGAMRALSTVEAELRAQDKAKEYTAKNIPSEVVMEHLRLITSDQRAHYRREMDAMDNTESVLG